MRKEAYFARQADRRPKELWQWCGDYVKASWPEETKQRLRIAGEVCRQTFVFDLPWDMERTYEPVTYSGNIDWEKPPFFDPEFVYQLNRHRYFMCLGQAYQLTGDEAYAKAFVHLLKDWISTQKLCREREGTSWRTIEAGIRGETWTKAISYFEESPELTDEVVELFEESLRVHGEYLLGAYTPFKVSSNWGVLENCGLYLIGSALDEERFREAALARLKEEAHTQIMGDGVQWEQSPMYHNEVLHCFMEVMHRIQAEKREVPAFLEETVRKMALANLAWKKPNHCQFAMGDSDETDLRDQLTHSAFLLKDETLKFGAYPNLDYEGAWDFGREGAQAYEKLGVCKPEQTDWFLNESGNAYLRSDWGEEGDLLHFRAGSLGGGHGHFDKLHVDLVLDGEDVLVDGGRYQYVFHEKRKGLKSSRAHNTVLVDRKDYTECLDSWTVTGTMPEIRQNVCTAGDYCMVQAGHLGYLQRGTDVYCHRKVLRLAKGLYLLADLFHSGSRHRFSEQFHFSPEGRLEGSGNVWTFLGKNTKAEFHFLGKDAEITEEASICSRHYNEYVGNQAICMTGEGSGIYAAYTVIAKGTAKAKRIPVFSIQKGEELDADYGEGVQIQYQGREYTVVFRYRDLAEPSGLIGIDGKMGLGKTMVFRDQEESAVLEW
ncbi:MAG: heparinase II/III family protein [Eubacteriales bacterium]|nr:heparinase II/III family protein [Eubacteriales bacterium]